MAMTWDYKKSKMIADIIYICLQDETTLSKEAKRAILKDFAWRYAEMSDVTKLLKNNIDSEAENPNKKTKKLGNKYWSNEALNQYRNSHNLDKLYFDHIVPKRIFIEFCIKNGDVIKNYKDNEFRELLDKILVGCIITKEENERLEDNKLRQKLPKSIEEKGLGTICAARWSRYNEVQIVPRELKWRAEKKGRKITWSIESTKNPDDYR